MTLEQFLALVREEIGRAGTDEYWRSRYEALKNKSKVSIKRELPYLAVDAVAVKYKEDNPE